MATPAAAQDQAVQWTHIDDQEFNLSIDMPCAPRIFRFVWSMTGVSGPAKRFTCDFGERGGVEVYAANLKPDPPGETLDMRYAVSRAVDAEVGIYNVKVDQMRFADAPGALGKEVYGHGQESTIHVRALARGQHLYSILSAGPQSMGFPVEDARVMSSLSFLN
jgi:hypothetical protein